MHRDTHIQTFCVVFSKENWRHLIFNGYKRLKSQVNSLYIYVFLLSWHNSQLEGGYFRSSSVRSWIPLNNKILFQMTEYRFSGKNHKTLNLHHPSFDLHRKWLHWFWNQQVYWCSKLYRARWHWCIILHNAQTNLYLRNWLLRMFH